MKKFLLSLFALCALSASAQRILIGDMNGDGVLSIADVTLLTSTILGERDAKYHVCITEQHEYVDLGLPSGTLWATRNVGAERAEDYGNYYAWGEIVPKSDYSWATYFDCVDGSSSNFKKYYNDGGKTELDLEDDAAFMNWGEDWRMPSMAQLDELLSECDWTWMTLNGMNGYLVKSRIDDSSIFLPAAGAWVESNFSGTFSNCNYWSCSLRMSGSERAYGLFFTSGKLYRGHSSRYQGYPVRPVRVATDIPFSPISVTSITLDSSSLTLEAGDTHTLSTVVAPEDATDKSVTWTSSDSNVATVSDEGVVTAVNAGTVTITATANDGSGVTAECVVEITMVHNGHEYVDLGLPSGTLWATTNVGASAPEGYGDYFAWGAKNSMTNYLWSTYFDSVNASDSNFKKYYNNGGKTELGLEDDVAYMNWGDGWRIPSLEQIQELYNTNYVKTEWTTQKGRNGWLITSKSNGASLFLPADGYRSGGAYISRSTSCHYWSRSLTSSKDSRAYSLAGDSSKVGSSSDSRYYGLSVRPVRVSTSK